MTAAQVAEDLAELSCVLIPLQGSQLLLPSVSIAEILPWRRVKALADTPDWCLGMLGWRGEMVPVVRFEVLNGAAPEARRSGRCLVVMNRARNSKGLAFYAIAAEGLPRLVQLASNDLTNESTRLGRGESVAVKVGTESAVIPNLDFIETAVAKLLR
ncbi:MAG: chemotaxis protein CheW [Pseudomonadales bacterium]|nr:chemotaxis protein CheW [Pseudomonadales bacterium]